MAGQAAPVSDERRSSRGGRSSNRKWCIDWRVVRGTKLDGFGASTAIATRCRLCLGMEMADRAVVDRAILAIAVPGDGSLFGGERGGSMTKAGKRVQRRTAQGNEPVERQEHAQQKCIRAPAGHEPSTLEFSGSSYWIDSTQQKPEQLSGMDKSEFEQTEAGLSIRFRHATGLCLFR